MFKKLLAIFQALRELPFKIKCFFLKIFLLLLLLTQMGWISVFTYTTFYYTYIPLLSHVVPVNLQFSGCGKERGICSYPSANTSLLQAYNEYRLAKGQNYRIVLNLDMPESEVNNRLGMFMVHVKMQNIKGENLQSSSVSTMLHFKSNIVSSVFTTLFLPCYFLGVLEEKQSISVELFDKYLEDTEDRLAFVHTIIESRNIEIYSAEMTITAEFSGLRYLMFYHWKFSAGVGITMVFAFLFMILVNAWQRCDIEVIARKLEAHWSCLKERTMSMNRQANAENRGDYYPHSELYDPENENIFHQIHYENNFESFESNVRGGRIEMTRE